MKKITYKDLVAEIAPKVKEYFPWDIEEKLHTDEDILFLDVRENQEYDTMHINNSLHVPRGILETAVEWDHEETEPELVEARNRQIVVVCRSGSRSIFAAYTLMLPANGSGNMYFPASVYPLILAVKSLDATISMKMVYRKR